MTGRKARPRAPAFKFHISKNTHEHSGLLEFTFLKMLSSDGTPQAVTALELTQPENEGLKPELCALLVGTQTSEAAVEHGTEIPYRIKYVITM